MGNYFGVQQYNPVGIFTSEVKVKKILLLGIYMKEAESFVKYPDPLTYNYYYDIGVRQRLPLENLSPEKLKDKESHRLYQFMIDSISNSKK